MAVTVRLKIHNGRRVDIPNHDTDYTRNDYTKEMVGFGGQAPQWSVQQYAYGNTDRLKFDLYTRDPDQLSLAHISHQPVYLELWDTIGNEHKKVETLFGGTITTTDDNEYGGVTMRYTCSALGWVFDLDNSIVTAYYEGVSDKTIIQGGEDVLERPVDALHLHVHEKDLDIDIDPEDVDKRIQKGVGHITVFPVADISYRQVLDQLHQETQNVWRISPEKKLYYHRRTRYISRQKLSDDPDNSRIQLIGADRAKFLTWDRDSTANVDITYSNGNIIISCSEFLRSSPQFLEGLIVRRSGRELKLWEQEIHASKSGNTYRLTIPARDLNVAGTPMLFYQAATYAGFRRRSDTSKLKNHIVVTGGVHITEDIYFEPFRAGDTEVTIGDWSALPKVSQTEEEAAQWPDTIHVRIYDVDDVESEQYTNQTVYLEGADGNRDAFDVAWDYRSGRLKFRAANATDKWLYVRGLRRTPYTVTGLDTLSIDQYDYQSLIIKDVSLTSADAVRRRVEAELRRWNVDLQRVEMNTTRHGFVVGERVALKNTLRGIDSNPPEYTLQDSVEGFDPGIIPHEDRNYIIDAITISDLGGVNLLYNLEMQWSYMNQTYDDTDTTFEEL